MATPTKNLGRENEQPSILAPSASERPRCRCDTFAGAYFWGQRRGRCLLSETLTMQIAQTHMSLRPRRELGTVCTKQAAATVLVPIAVRTLVRKIVATVDLGPFAAGSTEVSSGIPLRRVSSTARTTLLIAAMKPSPQIVIPSRCSLQSKRQLAPGADQSSSPADRSRWGWLAIAPSFAFQARRSDSSARGVLLQSVPYPLRRAGLRCGDYVATW